MTRIEQAWKQAAELVRTTPLEKQAIKLVRLSVESRFDIYGGVDDAGFRLLVVKIGAKPPSIKWDTKAFDCYRQPDSGGRWNFVLRLMHAGLDSVFGRLCQDLADSAETVANETELVVLIKARLGDWQKLFSRIGNEMLSLSEIKGLYCELSVLEHELKAAAGHLQEVVIGWQGPMGSDQDFHLAGKAIEVKAVSPEADRVTISSAGQLQADTPLELVLVFLRQAARTEHGADGLNQINARVESLLSSDPGALAEYRDRIQLAGYVEQDYYEGITFEVVETARYHVGDAFPRLTSTNIPAGIVTVEYSVDLAAIDEFAIGDTN